MESIVTSSLYPVSGFQSVLLNGNVMFRSGQSSLKGASEAVLIEMERARLCKKSRKARDGEKLCVFVYPANKEFTGEVAYICYGKYD